MHLRLHIGCRIFSASGPFACKPSEQQLEADSVQALLWAAYEDEACLQASAPMPELMHLPAMARYLLAPIKWSLEAQPILQIIAGIEIVTTSLAGDKLNLTADPQQTCKILKVCCKLSCCVSGKMSMQKHDFLRLHRPTHLCSLKKLRFQSRPALA